MSTGVKWPPGAVLTPRGPPFDFENVEVVIDGLEEHLVNTWRSEEGTFAKGGQEKRDWNKNSVQKSNEAFHYIKKGHKSCNVGVRSQFVFGFKCLTRVCRIRQIHGSQLIICI